MSISSIDDIKIMSAEEFFGGVKKSGVKRNTVSGKSVSHSSSKSSKGDSALRLEIIQDPHKLGSLDCSRLSALDWAFILREHPDLGDRCDWDAFETDTVEYYGHPLHGNAWHCLLMKQPHFAARCSWRFAKEWDDVDNKRYMGFSRWYWVVLLCENPQFADKCNWSAFDGYDISNLAKLINSGNIDLIQWSRLGGKDWGILLDQRPDLLEKCDFRSFRGVDWVWALVKCNLLKEHCDWGKLGKDEWQGLVAMCPAFEKELEKYSKYTLKDIDIECWDPFDWGLC